MRAKLVLSPQIAPVLLALLNLLRVHADAPIDLEKPQTLQKATNEGRRDIIKVRPHSVFQDSFAYLWELSSDSCYDPLERVSFADDAKVDPNRWFHLMTTWIFAPSSQLFKRDGEPYEDGTLVYSIYPDKSYRSEGEQLEYLRVAGRFVGKLLERGLILNQRFNPEVYARLSELPFNTSGLPRAQTLSETRLAEFVGGIRDVVTLDALIGIERSRLVEFMHGVAFEGLPDWQPHIIVEDDHGNHANMELSNMLKQTILELGHGLIPKLWSLLTGMRRLPLREISEPQGLIIKMCTDPDSSLGGFSVNLSRRLLELRPTREEVLLPLLLEPSYFEPVWSYHWLKYSMERIFVRDDRPQIEIDIDTANILEELSPIVDDVARFVASTVTFRGKFLANQGSKHRFFTLALPRIVGPSCGLFKRVDGPGMPRPTVDLSPEIANDEARHLHHLHVAGLVFGKAIREFFGSPVALSDRLYELICTQASPVSEKGNSDEETRLHARYAVFVGGIHKVIPNWMLSSLSPNSLAVLFDSSRWSPLIVQSLIRRTSVLSPKATESDRIFFSNRINKLIQSLLSPPLQPAQLSTFFWLILKRPINVEELFTKSPGLSVLNTVVEPTRSSFSIFEGRISVPDEQDLIHLSSLLNVVLTPSRLTAMATGRDAIGQEMSVVTAQMGQIFQSFFESYKMIGEERFLQQSTQLIVTSDGKEVTRNDEAGSRAFLLFTELCSTAKRPFAYTLRHGRGSYDLDEGEMEDDEEVHLEKLRLIGILLATLTVIYARKPLILLSPRLQQLTYWGREAGGGPLSPREAALLGGFHAIAPPDAIQLMTCQEWCDYLDADPEYLSLQAGSLKTHSLVVKLSRTLFVSAEETQFATWERYVQYVHDHTNDFVTAGFGLSCQFHDFIAMAFEEECELFAVNEGKYVLREVVAEDEGKHLRALRVTGLLIGKSIQMAYPVDLALHNSIYFCLKNHGILPDDLNLSALMRERISAFVGGIFAVVSPVAFVLLTEQEIAQLFEWRLPLNAEAVRSRDLEPPMEPGSIGERALDAFWGAIESFPAAVKGQILCLLCNVTHFTDGGIYNTFKLTLGATPTEDMSVLFSMDPTTHQIPIPIVDTVETYRRWLFSLIDWSDNCRTQRLVRLAKLTLNERLSTVHMECRIESPIFTLTTWRGESFSDALFCYSQHTIVSSPGQWIIRFIREDGLEEAQDAGGVLREWIHDIVADILSPERMLFAASSTGTGACHIFPETTSGEEKDNMIVEYELAGIVFGKAFLEGIPVGIRFIPIIYMLMLQEGPLELFDYVGALRELDPKAYKGLAYIMEHKVDELDLYFEVLDSEGTSHSLLPGGEAMAVTEANKMTYLLSRAEYMLLGKAAGSVKAFIKGFHVTAPPCKLQTFMFTGREIEHVLYGRDSIDVDEWERMTVYTEGREPSGELIKWFWALMREFTPERRQQMLFFTTSLNRVPVDGFGGIPGGKFTIQMASKPDSEALPESQTCFSTLKLHPYKSREKMKEKLEKTLDLASKGFGTV